ncbi:MAG TPA: hypothetical protein VF609_07110 [Flavisolibacter sp.]|jgi:hypothetical protein
MKKIIFLLSLAIAVTGASVMAQTKGTAKIYGYQQQVSGGASPDRSQAPGSGDRQRAGVNYYIYLSLPGSVRIYPAELWINGVLYGVQFKMESKTPVLLQSNDPALNDRVLVSKTAQKVIQLIPIPANGAKKSAKGHSLAKANEVVVVYKQNGKFYYSSLQKLTGLENAAMQ